MPGVRCRRLLGGLGVPESPALATVGRDVDRYAIRAPEGGEQLPGRDEQRLRLTGEPLSQLPSVLYVPVGLALPRNAPQAELRPPRQDGEGRPLDELPAAPAVAAVEQAALGGRHDVLGVAGVNREATEGERRAGLPPDPIGAHHEPATGGVVAVDVLVGGGQRMEVGGSKQ